MPFSSLVRHTLKTLCLALLFSSSAMAASIAVSGQEVIGDYHHLTMNITISEITASVVKDSPSDADMALYLRIFLDKEQTKYLPFGAQSSSTDSNVYNKFYWQYNSSPVVETVNSTKTVTYSISIYADPNATDPLTLAAIKDATGAVKIKTIQFVRLNSNGSSDGAEGALADLSVTQIFAKPAVAPEGFALNSGHKDIQISWTKALAVNYTDGQTRSPSEMLVMVFNPAADNMSLAAKVVNSDTATYDDSECRYIPGDTNCIDCDTAQNVFVSSTQDSHEGITYFKSVTNGGAVTINQLDVTKEYTVVLQYTDGTVRTECKTIQPKLNMTLTEANGAPEGVEGDPRCYIATAAFGSGSAWQVMQFRWLRDTFLLTNPVGRAVVRAYYENGEAMSAAIKSSPVLKSIVMAILWPLSYVLLALSMLWAHFTLWALGGMLAILLVVLGWKTRAYLRSPS